MKSQGQRVEYIEGHCVLGTESSGKHETGRDIPLEGSSISVRWIMVISAGCRFKIL